MDDLLALSSFALWAIVACVACCAAGYLLLKPLDRGVTGLMLGLLLGPLGLVIAWIMRENGYRERSEYQRRHERPASDGSTGSTDFGQRSAGIRAHAAPAAAGQKANVAEELERLAALKERGHLSDQEFGRLKSKLIDDAANSPQRLPPFH